jgi:multicomponent Na+:H+ antiporter subunit B
MNLKKVIPLKTILVSLLISFITIVLIQVFINIELIQNSLGDSLLEINTQQTQSANAVTSVVTYFRALDTLGEVTILFLSIFGVSLTLENMKQKSNIFAYENQILQIAAKVITPLIILFGIYIIVHGHLSPGGGFQGGVIIASGFLLRFLAYGDGFNLNHKIVSLFESLSGAGFVLAGILSFLLVDKFLGNFLPLGDIGALLSGGVIPIIYIFVGLKVASEITVMIEYFLKREK